MILRKTWQRTALWLGLGWSILWSLVLSEMSFTRQLDLWISDRLTRLNPPHPPPPEILLLPISQSDLNRWGTPQEAAVYSNLVNRLLDAQAKAIILNLHPHWLQTSDHANHPIKILIQKYSDRIVIVLPTTNVTQQPASAWRSYDYLLPATSLNQPLFPPRSILGFVEYEPEARQPNSLDSTARQANLTGQFTLSHYLDHTIELSSFAALSLQKLQPQQPLTLPTGPVQARFWGATGTFPRLSATSVLSDRSPPVRGKIILVGFSDVQNPDVFPIQSPYGELMPGIEWQANLLASLLTRSCDRIVPVWLQELMIVGGSILLSGWIVWGTLKTHRSRSLAYGLLPILGLGLFFLIAAGLYWQHWILPITLPLFTWATTGLSVWLSLRMGLQQDLINQQQCELDRLHTAEQKAVISQSRKLLLRIASNIHDGPLQELKLVMDRLELLQLDGTITDLNPILDQLERFGTHLREQLSATREIALEITPELRDGLDHGIQAQLHQLSQSGDLSLQVIQDIHPLEEPTLNSLWLEAREDIFRFFIEAIHNVIRHAQPPHGSATYVKVSLEQHNSHCTLTIENNGVFLDPSVFQPTPLQRQEGGYGMKLMETIAAELPHGSLQRTSLKPGGLQVQLTWEQNFRLN